MPPNYSSQTKTLTQLLHSQSLTPNQLQQIHTQLLIQTPSLTPPLNLSNSLISAYASSSAPTNAFTFFKSHTHPSNFANSFTFQSLLKSSSKCRSIAQTTQLHSLILKLGFMHQIQIQNALIKCYIVCGLLDPARYMFGEMPKRDTVSYNTMISGYFELGDMGSAEELFGCVPNPNKITWTAMITGFCNSGDISSARRHFDEMPEKDLVSWNAMVSGYVHNQQPIRALELFSRMQLERFRPNRVTVVGVLAACASLGALDAGKWVHVYAGQEQV